MQLGNFEVREPQFLLNNIVYNNFRPIQSEDIDIQTKCMLVNPSLSLQEKKDKVSHKVIEKLCLLETNLVVTTDIFFLSLSILCQVEILNFQGVEFESIDGIEIHELEDLTKFAGAMFRELVNKEIVDFLKKTPTKVDSNTIFWPADSAVA